MKVKEVADLAGISVRTLHHYDKIGLLVPYTDKTGYRLYNENDLELLQQILFFKELDFPLKKIKQIIGSSFYNRQSALLLQQKMLLEKRKRIDSMLKTIEKTIKHMKGDIEMTDKEKFEGFDFSKNPYETEARKLWGDEAVDYSNAKVAGMSKDQRKVMSESMEYIFRQLAALRSGSPVSDKAQEIIKKWYELLNNSIGRYSPEIFKGLGRMYVEDERFTKNIDKYGEGLAEFMCKAMEAFADSIHEA